MNKAEANQQAKNDDELMNFIGLFEKCCNSYTHVLYGKISKNKYFI